MRGNAAATRALSDGVPDQDPAIIAVARWRLCDAVAQEKGDKYTNAEQAYAADPRNRTAYEQSVEADLAHHSAIKASTLALGRAFVTLPSTTEGAIELIRAMMDEDDGALEHPGLEDGLRTIIRFLEGLRPRGTRREPLSE